MFVETREFTTYIQFLENIHTVPFFCTQKVFHVHMGCTRFKETPVKPGEINIYAFLSYSCIYNLRTGKSATLLAKQFEHVE